MNTLLTPQKVADILALPIRTVYANKEKLGGFYPAGIKCLRFHPDIINEHLERQKKKGLALLVSVPGEDLRGRRPQDKGRDSGSQGRAEKKGQGGNPGRDRHGLFGVSQ